MKTIHLVVLVVATLLCSNRFAVALPIVELDPDEIFMSNIQASSSTSGFITVYNYGDQPLELSNFSLSGPHAAYFEYRGLPAYTLGPDTSASLELAFAANSGGDYYAFLDFNTNDPDNADMHYIIEGFGGASQITVSSNYLSFPDTSVANGVTTKSLTITNIGDREATFTVENVKIINDPTNSYALADSLDLSPLSPGASREIIINFDPNNTGWQYAYFNLTYYNYSYYQNYETLSVHLAGKGIAPEIHILHGSFDFGHHVIDEPQTRWRDGMISNYGNLALTMTGAGMAITGTHASDFVLNSTLTGGSQVTSSVLFEVAFDPQSIGEKQATLVITSDDPTSPIISLSLMGRGLLDRATTLSGQYSGYGPGLSTIGNNGDYETLFAASEDIGKYPLTGGDWEFVIISDLYETSQSLLSQYDTNGNHITIRPDGIQTRTVNFIDSRSPITISPPSGNLIIGATLAPDPNFRTDSRIWSSVPTRNITLSGNTPGETNGKRGLVLSNLGGETTNNVISILDDSDNITLIGCGITATSGNVNNAAGVSINYSSYPQQYGRSPRLPDNLTIQNCEITTTGNLPCDAITAYSSREWLTHGPILTGNSPSNVLIQDNIILTNANGIGPIAAADCQIRNNEITIKRPDSIYQWDYCCGIACVNTGASNNSSMAVVGNTVRYNYNPIRPFDDYAAITLHSELTNSHFTIANNMILSTVGLGKHIGISCCSSKPASAMVANNSIFLAAGASDSPEIYCGGLSTYNTLYPLIQDNNIIGWRPGSIFTGTYQARNNIVRVEQPGANAWLLPYNTGSIVSDKNDLSVYGLGGNVGAIGETPHLSLQDWRTAIGQDLHSFSQNPFEPMEPELGIWTKNNADSTQSDLHFTRLPGEAYFGEPLVTITEDIDGELRDSTRPTIGADEPISRKACAELWDLY